MQPSSSPRVVAVAAAAAPPAKATFSLSIFISICVIFVGCGLNNLALEFIIRCASSLPRRRRRRSPP